MATAKSNPHIKIKGIKFIKSFAGIDEYQLDNGLKILLKPNPEVPLFSWQVWYKVGSRNEDLGRTGLAHYLEHIMFKGTETFAKGEIAQSIQLRGGVFNAFTSDDYTAYFENFAPENLELAIKIESDRMQNSRLDADEVDLERSVIVSELEGNKNNPGNVMYESLRSTAFQVHTYRNPVIGWRDDLDNINAKNMRKFYEKYYYPDNAVAILIGNFDPELALDLIKKYFGQYKGRDKKLPKVPKEPEQKALRKVVIRNGGFMKLLGVAFHVPEFKHKDTPALSVIAEVVFNGMASRLYPKLVDTGLAISVSAVPEPSYDPGIFRIMVNLNTEADIEKVEQIVDAELEAVKQGVTEEELKVAKAKEEASYVYQSDGVYDEGLQIGYFEAVSGDWTKYANWVNDINAVSNEDIKRVAKKYFRESNKSVVHLLPEPPRDSLVQEEVSNGNPAQAASDTEDIEPVQVANYGAASVEPLDPKKLKHLLEITEPKFSKDMKQVKYKFKFKEIDLGIDGIKVYHREDHSLPLLYLNAYLYAGSAAAPDKLGLAHLTGKMLNRGSKAKDKYEIAKLTDLYGADVSFDSGRETARVHVSTLTKYIPEVMGILDEILAEPRFDPGELEKLKTQTISKIKQEDDYLNKVAKREVNQIIYPKDHLYYSHSVEDRIKAIEAVTIDDIKQFYKSSYNANNLLVSIVGDISEAKAKELILKSFAGWNVKDKGKGNKPPEIPLVSLKNPQEQVVNKAEKKQTEVIMAHACHVDRLNPDYYPLLIANFALGGSSLSSRLGTAVRDEHGYVYNIRSNLSATLGSGAYSIILGANPKNVRRAIDLTKEVVQDFLKTGINDTELKVTKSYLIGSFAVRTLESNERIVDTLSQLQAYKLGDDYIDTYADRINAITLDEVNRVARKYIHPDKFHVVIVGPESSNSSD